MSGGNPRKEMRRTARNGGGEDRNEYVNGTTTKLGSGIETQAPQKGIRNGAPEQGGMANPEGGCLSPHLDSARGATNPGKPLATTMQANAKDSQQSGEVALRMHVSAMLTSCCATSYINRASTRER